MPFTFPIYTAPGTAVSIPLGSSIQAAINANPANTVFQLAAGVYRETNIQPKSGNVFYGATSGGNLQTIINGSKVVSPSLEEFGLYVITNQTQNGPIWYTIGQWKNNEDGWESEATPESVFLDDTFLKHVSTSKVITSTDTISFSNGNKIINIPAGANHGWTVGQKVRIVNYDYVVKQHPDWLEGTISDIQATTLTINVTSTAVKANTPTTRSSWSIFIVLDSAGLITVLDSTTSRAIGIGSKTFTISNGVLSAWKVGQPVRAANSVTNWMEGEITAISETSITINVLATSGSGTFANWFLTEVVQGTFYFDYLNNKVYIANDPAGKTIEITENQPRIFNIPNNNVALKNLILEKCASGPQQPGCVDAEGSGILIDGCEIRLTHGTAARLNGTNSSVYRSWIHDFGSKGIGIPGNGSVAEGCEISNGNVKLFEIGYDAAGIKTSGNNVYIRRNYIHDVNARGIWTDVDPINVVVEDNTLERTRVYGVCFEISYACCAINNKVRLMIPSNLVNQVDGANPNTAISAQSCVDCVMEKNIVVVGDNGGGTNVRGMDLTYQENRHVTAGVSRQQHCRVIDNDIYHTGGTAAKSGTVTTGSNLISPPLCNRFYSNRYHVPDPDGSFCVFAPVFSDTSSLKQAIYRGHEIDSTADTATYNTSLFNYSWAAKPTRPNIPTVDPISTTLNDFYISGWYNSENAKLVQVIANGVSYTTANGLRLNTKAGRWVVSLTNVPVGTMDVIVRVTAQNDVIYEDTTSNQVVVLTAQPPVPFVDSLSTADTTPLITGGYRVGVDPYTIGILLNNVYYRQSDGITIDKINKTWSFNVPTALSLGLYSVGVSTISDSGEYTDTVTNNALEIRAGTVTTLNKPSINRLISYIKYPILTGKYDPLATAVSVTVNGITYTTSNGLGLNPLLGLWSLQLPVFTNGTYSVTVTTSDANGSISDNTSVELIVSEIENGQNHGYRFSLADSQIN